eukprot:TRINITY_DN22302_c0_g1_i1.p1 TRINITY_DN22302_c0_g1~~TRINITY_DN22302_c0_g1_i1.p1  ORF type:complete len:156 (+),score=36.28 TRINITY_DN22302_c0_g1_i1:47-469(+)
MVEIENECIGNTVPAEIVQPHRYCWKLKSKLDRLTELGEEINQLNPSELRKKVTDGWSKRLVDITSDAVDILQELSKYIPAAGSNSLPDNGDKGVKEQQKKDYILVHNGPIPKRCPSFRSSFAINGFVFCFGSNCEGNWR